LKEKKTVANVLRFIMVGAAFAMMSSSVFAQAAAPAGGFSMNLGAAVGCGIIILGAGLGIGRIGSNAVEGMSRQPEAAGSIQTAMIISAALIEGVTLLALIVAFIKG
jgi:F-type H+-transporting ATPase subunit c